MAHFILDYYDEKDFYSDGDIEKTIYNIVKEGRGINSLKENEKRFPVIYHLSPVRENILCWYNFRKGAHVLEIGSGCGAITGMLCEKAGYVTSVELSKRRATINYERNKHYENLDIVVANLNNVKFELKFDYIILNGVYEYAASYTKSQNPYVDFLKYVSQWLKNDGIILVAIENRLGAKYFAGAPEDHLDIYFKGLNEYSGVDSVKTFSKKEFENICNSAGLECSKYYYPYPDYKFPTEIFTDKTINTDMYGRNGYQFNDKKLELIDEVKLHKSFAQEGVADVFSNSFLIEVCKKSCKTCDNDDLLYVKLSTDRNDEFKIWTRIIEKNGEKKVEKIPATSDSKKHIDDMKKYCSISDKYEYLPFDKTYEETLCYDYINSENLDEKVSHLIKKKNKDEIINLIDDIYKAFFATTKEMNPYDDKRFIKVFGLDDESIVEHKYKCVNNMNIDIILDNIYEINGKYTVIDYEWIFDFYIPSEYIMWRLINELYYNHNELYDLIDRIELQKKYGITEKCEGVFRHWEHSFANVYVGSGRLNEYNQKLIKVDLEKYVHKTLSKRVINSKLYFDFGNGFSEENTKCAICNLGTNGKFDISFNVSNITEKYKLRWDPDDVPCKINNIEFLVDKKKVELIPIGISESEHGDVFLSEDPFYIIDGEFENVDCITISGNIESIVFDDELYDNIKAIEANLCAKIVERDNKIVERDNKIVERDNQIVERDNQIVERDNQIKGHLELIEEQKKCIDDGLEVINLKDNAIGQLQNELNIIKNSKLWIMYRVKNYIKRKLRKEPSKIINSGLQLAYSIDNCDYSLNKLLVRGWIYITDRCATKLCVVVECNSRCIELEVPSFPQKRPDVVAAFENENALYSGFTAEFDLLFNGIAKVYLKVYADEVCDYVEIASLESENEEYKDTLEFSLYSESLKKDLDKYWNVNGWVSDKRFSEKKVDIIVPIYNGYDYLEKLFEGLQKTSLDINVILMEDCSPDERIRPFIEDYRNKHDNVTVVYNETNLGFVKSVNKGLSYTSNDVVLVNTDVELPEFWLERLMQPIFENEKVASTTPYSNSATIFSFPNFAENNRIYKDMTVDEIDSYFAKIVPPYTVVPTGMGFCMGMSRKAIDAIGDLDAETFGKGYGEENDWCRRAIKDGFTNVHVENLFVYHKHGGSFASDEKQKLLDENSKKLSKKHPEYLADVASYCENDPTKKIRNIIRIIIDSQLKQGENILVFDHDLGGGATAYLNQRVLEWNEKDNNTFIVRYSVERGDYKLHVENGDFKTDYFVDSLDDIRDIFRLIKINKIIINELVTYPELKSVLEYIVDMANDMGAELIMLMHDYFSVCPSINLLSDNGQFCHDGKEHNCKECFSKFGWDSAYDCSSIDEWRKIWRKFFDACNEVRSFSEDTLERLNIIYPGLNNTSLVPHQVNYITKVERKKKTTSTLNVGLIGVLSEHKGKKIVESLVRECEKVHSDIRFILIGYVDGENIESPNFFSTGKYSVEQLPRLVLENDIDVFLIPSIWPETFSYTTEEIMKMGMPIMSYDIGAPASRIKKYDKGAIINSTKISDALVEIETFARQQINSIDICEDDKYVLFIAEYISFSSRYRAEHAMEQLLCAGVRSRLVETKDLLNVVDMDKISHVVIYRCRWQSPLSEFIDKLGEGIPVLYDIDDYIFDYSKIKHQEFLKDDEYNDFKEYSAMISQCMSKANAFTTSTEALAGVITEYFKKPVLVNRNVASMEMFVLSQKALETKPNNGSKVVLGYFSGSKTHNADFEMIEDAIVATMKNNCNVELLIVGCLKVSEKFNGVADRITRKEFVPWQELPALIASVDINLMPLEDSFFNECKSENKWMEAALVKTLTVASYNKELGILPVNGENIVFCKNNEEWMDKLNSLVNDESSRKLIAENAYEYVVNNKITCNTYDRLYDFIRNEC